MAFNLVHTPQTAENGDLTSLNGKNDLMNFIESENKKKSALGDIKNSFVPSTPSSTVKKPARSIEQQNIDIDPCSSLPVDHEKCWYQKFLLPDDLVNDLISKYNHAPRFDPEDYPIYEPIEEDWPVPVPLEDYMEEIIPPPIPDDMMLGDGEYDSSDSGQNSHEDNGFSDDYAPINDSVDSENESERSFFESEIFTDDEDDSNHRYFK